jgi:hypothetical protein
MLIKKMCIGSFTAFTLVLMLTFSVFVSVQASEIPAHNMPPDMPNDAMQYNRTDITPQGQVESLQEMKMNVFFYRNVTLLMNTTRNCEMNITIDNQVTNKVIAVNVDPNRTMTLAINCTVSPPTGVATMERTLNLYMGLEPNTTLQLQAQLRLLINQTELSEELGREVNASRLTWMYWNQTQNQWEPVESHMDENGYLVCNTDHFSTWTVAETTEDIPEGIQVITVIGLVIAVTVATTLWKRKKPINKQ